MVVPSQIVIGGAVSNCLMVVMSRIVQSFFLFMYSSEPQVFIGFTGFSCIGATLDMVGDPHLDMGTYFLRQAKYIIFLDLLKIKKSSNCSQVRPVRSARVAMLASRLSKANCNT